MIINQEELRERYRKYLERGKQIYVAKVTGINVAILSKFKTGKFKELYPHIAEKLDQFLSENE